MLQGVKFPVLFITTTNMNRDRVNWEDEILYDLCTRETIKRGGGGRGESNRDETTLFSLMMAENDAPANWLQKTFSSEDAVVNQTAKMVKKTKGM